MENVSFKTYVSTNFKKNLLNTELRLAYIAGWEETESFSCTTIVGCPDLLLPGLDVLGLICLIDEELLKEDEFLEICKKQLYALKVERDDPLFLFVYKSEGKSVEIISRKYLSNYNSLQKGKVVEVDRIPAILFRATGQFPLVLEVSPDIETLKENIESGIERLRSVIQSNVPAFLLKNSNIVLPNINEEDRLDYAISYKRLCNYQNDELNEKLNKKKDLKNKPPMHFDILMQWSGKEAQENSVNHTLVIHCQRREFQCVSLKLPVDVLAMGQESYDSFDLYKLLVKAILHQVEHMQQCLLLYASAFEYVCPVPHHFFPDVWDVPVTILYPSSKTDQELVTQHQQLHRELFLPMDQPYLRKGCVHSFSGVTASGCLVSPHQQLPGSSTLVRGRYSYHHYMQDRMNDDGWGCAYRSLQTIVSWFRFQGFTDAPVPTHTQIQQALVDVGDKPASFVGSRQWIGSQEVCFCLERLLQVQSRILFVSSGEQLASKGRELATHFREQGTPVMIGGGVLAHTILGVDFNPDTGDLKFLILDPHYTGPEDLHIVLNKGWCGWKGTKFWDQGAFYNLCLPQRPQEI